MSYTYDATGTKLTKTVSGSSRYYIDGIEYNGSTIEFIHTEEGIARKSGSDYIYEYNLQDHLGNTRVTFIRDPITGLADELQRDDYYPFGKRNITLAGSNDNKYLYNGKELQDELGQYDYGARFYDPLIARWIVVDALADEDEQSDKSPYAYTWNNPINLTDPDGNCPDCPDQNSMASSIGFIGSDLGKAFKALPGKILSFTDANDATVLATSITRGKNAVNIDGSKATLADKGFAIAGIILPIISGSAVKKAVKYAGEKLADAGKAISQTASKGAVGGQNLSKVEKSKTVQKIGDFTKKTEVRPGKGPGQSRAEYTTYKNKEGKTIKTYKDSYDRSNKYQGRKPLRGGPEGRVQ